MSCLETLTFYAGIVLGDGWSSTDRKDQAVQVLGALGLGHAANTLVSFADLFVQMRTHSASDAVSLLLISWLVLCSCNQATAALRHAACWQTLLDGPSGCAMRMLGDDVKPSTCYELPLCWCTHKAFLCFPTLLAGWWYTAWWSEPARPVRW